jgi:diadenosine tetraphosphate (Ap4A) HIT family hydrolase
MEARQCGLCREAEKQPTDQPVFFLKDINPAKPHRWLALPRSHAHSFAALSPAERTELWAGAIAKAKELFNDDSWGLATNGRAVVTQCHTHIHIGKLLAGIETDNFVTVSKPEEIPVPENEGFWIHPAGGKLHVHRGEQVTETVLLR